MRSLLTISVLAVALIGQAQWEVPVRIVLDGDSAADRQVSGLADPIVGDAAVSLDAMRANTVGYAMASGDQALVADLQPIPDAYTMGMTVTIMPTVANRASPTINLNGLGAVPLIKWGGQPLDSADLVPGLPARLVHDGLAFQLMNSAYLNCPDGFHPSSARTCIQTTSSDSTTFFQAVEHCNNMGAQLCSMTEWIHACRTMPPFLSTVFGGEWVDNAANEQSGAKYMGTGIPGGASGGHNGTIGCQYGYYVAPTASRRFRCCIKR